MVGIRLFPILGVSTAARINAARMLGRISKISENYVTLQIAGNVEIQVQRPAVQVLLPKGTIKSIE